MHGREVNTGGGPIGNGHAASRLVAAPGIGDDEHSIHDGKSLCLPCHHAKPVDEHVVDQLSNFFTQHSLQYDVDRINELRDDSGSHAWLLSLDASTDGTDSRESTTAVRIRLGAQHADDTQVCRACGASVIDPFGVQHFDEPRICRACPLLLAPKNNAAAPSSGIH